MTHTDILDMIEKIEPDLTRETRKMRGKIEAGVNVNREMKALAFHATSGFNDFMPDEIRQIRESFS